VPKKPATLQYIFFALVAAAALTFFALNGLGQYKFLWRGHEQANLPVSLGESNHVDFISREAVKAGIRKGDRILEVNGEPLRGSTMLHQVANESRPGDPVQLSIERQDGSRATLTFPLPPMVRTVRLNSHFASSSCFCR
jgi:membrane-associated protease RseP (regulator of RpoE activity)